MKFSKVASLAMLEFVAAEGSIKCGTAETVTQTTIISKEHTVTAPGTTETQTITSAVTITETKTHEVTINLASDLPGKEQSATVTNTTPVPELPGDEQSSTVSKVNLSSGLPGEKQSATVSKAALSSGLPGDEQSSTSVLAVVPSHTGIPINGSSQVLEQSSTSTLAFVTSQIGISIDGSSQVIGRVPTALPSKPGNPLIPVGGINSTVNLIPPYTAEHSGRITSCDYADGKSTVFEFLAAAATQGGHFSCNKAIYKEAEVIVNVILELKVTIEIIEETITILKTSTTEVSRKPTRTPIRPPPPSRLHLIDPKIGNESFSSNETYHFPSTNQTAPKTTLSNVTAPGRIHPIDVSVDDRFMYESNHLNATVGEYLQFEFQGTNFTVHESTLEHPCSPLSGGFTAGFNQTNSNTTIHIAHSMQIKDESPHYFFCGRSQRECSKETVFAVNVGTEVWNILEENIAQEHSLRGHRFGPKPLKGKPQQKHNKESKTLSRKILNWWA